MAQLSEHQPVGKEEAKDTPHTEDDQRDQDVVRYVEGLLKKAKRKKAKVTGDQFLKFYKFFRGQQWQRERPSYRSSEVINLIWQSIQAQVPILLDARPKVEFFPQNPADMEIAKILNHMYEHDATRGNWGNKNAELLYDGHIYGTGFSALRYDPDADNGLGMIVKDSLDPLYVYPDPSAKTLDDAAYVIVAEPTCVDKVKTMYPQHKAKIRPDMSEGGKDDRHDRESVKFTTPTDRPGKVEDSGHGDYSFDSDDRVLLITCYVKSDEVIEEEKINEGPEGEEVYYEKRLKFPNGRKIVIANNVVLEDGANELESGQFPYARYINYHDPHQFWGIGDVEPLIKLQESLNKTVSLAMDSLVLMGNPQWLVPHEAGIDTDNLFNRPGAVIEYDGEARPTREQGLGVPPSLTNLTTQYENWMNEMSGMTDVSRGVKPENISAGVAIAQLQEAALTRLRQKTRNFDAYFQELGQRYYTLAIQNYTVPRVIKLTENESANKYFRVSINKEEIEGKVVNTMRVQDIYVEAEPVSKREVMREGEIRNYQIQGSFDVKVGTGSTLPFAKQVKKQELTQLFQLGVIDDETLLRGMDLPNAESIIQKNREMKEAQAQAQAAQGPPPA